MSIFDRFTSRKGKAEKAAPKRPTKDAANDAAKKTAFQQVPADIKPADVAKSATTLKDTGPAHRVLRGAIVTEKSARLEAQSQYAFAVASDATKKTVSEAIKKVYGIQPVAVNIVSLPGKFVRYGRSFGRQIKRKKAIVTLPPGKKIDIVSA